MPNENLKNAKRAKNDEFYTQWADIEKEISAYIDFDKNVFRDKTVLLPCDDPEWSNFTKFFAQNFSKFGLKKLISTSYAFESKKIQFNWQPTLFEQNAPQFDKDKTKSHGKIFTLDRNSATKIDIDALQWHYLQGDGDFRSEEVTKLRDEANFIITNPPFSLFREFLAWIVAGKKGFSILGNINAITYKKTFPLIKNNILWLGPSITSGDRPFEIPPSVVNNKFTGEVIEKNDGKHFYQRVSGVRWFTNIEHGRRHQPLQLMTMKDNIKFSKHKEVRGHQYQKYDNYDAIEVPFTDAIPSDYTQEKIVSEDELLKLQQQGFQIEILEELE